MRSRWILALALAVPALLVGSVTTRAEAKPPGLERTMRSAQRFKVLAGYGGAAVIDHETGLVWPRGADTVATFSQATLACIRAEIGGRRGWRLPTATELLSLADGPTLPDRHPFEFSGSGFWTATADPEHDDMRLVVRLEPVVGVGGSRLESNRYVICVRGAHVLGTP